MTPARLAEAGQALYGSQWQSEMAHALHVDPRRVRSWIAGERSIPAGVWPELVTLLVTRGHGQIALAGEIADERHYP